MIKNLQYKKTLEFSIIEENKEFNSLFYDRVAVFLDSIKFDKELLTVYSKNKAPFGINITVKDDEQNIKNDIYNSSRFVLVFNNDRKTIENTIKTGGIPLFFYDSQRGLAKIKWSGGKNIREIILKLKKICEKYWWYNRKIVKFSKQND